MNLPPVVRDHASEAFFDGTARGVLVLRRCDSCGAVRGPEVVLCGSCSESAFTWFDATGTGHVESWIVLHPRTPDAGEQPRVVVTVELTEGPWFVSALVGCDPAAIHHGMPVVVAFERPIDSESIPIFHPASL
jgi:uncharacterized protein